LYWKARTTIFERGTHPLVYQHRTGADSARDAAEIDRRLPQHAFVFNTAAADVGAGFAVTRHPHHAVQRLAGGWVNQFNGGQIGFFVFTLDERAHHGSFARTGLLAHVLHQQAKFVHQVGGHQVVAVGTGAEQGLRLQPHFTHHRQVGFQVLPMRRGLDVGLQPRGDQRTPVVAGQKGQGAGGRAGTREGDGRIGRAAGAGCICGGFLRCGLNQDLQLQGRHAQLRFRTCAHRQSETASLYAGLGQSRQHGDRGCRGGDDGWAGHLLCTHLGVLAARFCVQLGLGLCAGLATRLPTRLRAGFASAVFGGCFLRRSVGLERQQTQAKSHCGCCQQRNCLQALRMLHPGPRRQGQPRGGKSHMTLRWAQNRVFCPSLSGVNRAQASGFTPPCSLRLAVPALG